MPIDPKVEANLIGIEKQLDTLEDVSTNIQGLVSDVRKILGGVTPPPPTETPISIVSVTAERIDATSVRVLYTLAGTLSRATKVAIAVAGATVPIIWQEFPAPQNYDQVLILKVPNSNAGRFHFHVWDNGLTTTEKWVIKRDIPYSVYNDPNPPPPPPPGQGVFTFDSIGGNLSLLKDGKLMIPRGFNMPGPNGYWGGGYTPMGKAATLKQDWKVNLIRLFEQDPGGGECNACPSAHNPWSIDDVIAEYTAQGIVVMVDYHQFDFGRTYGQEQTNKMIQFWTPIATRHKDNPLVWFNLANEPENDSGGTDLGGMANRWYNAFAPVIDAVRATGAKNMIVIDDGNAGQGCSDYFHMGPSSGSAIMARGTDLLAHDPTGNLMWDMHSYDNMGWLAPGEANNNCANRYTDIQRDARFIDYVRRVWQATGRPVLIGEFGWRVGDRPDSGSGFHYPYTTCGSRTYTGQQSFTRNGVALNTGGTQWTGFQVTYSGSNAYDSNNRTECGNDWWNFCQNAYAKENNALIGDRNAMNKLASSAKAQLDRMSLARPRRNTLGVPSHQGAGRL